MQQDVNNNGIAVLDGSNPQNPFVKALNYEIPKDKIETISGNVRYPMLVGRMLGECSSSFFPMQSTKSLRTRTLVCPTSPIQRQVSWCSLKSPQQEKHMKCGSLLWTQPVRQCVLLPMSTTSGEERRESGNRFRHQQNHYAMPR